MRLFCFVFLGILLWSTACRNAFESSPSSGRLAFSTDSLFLDTIFSNISSSTYSFKVYNRTNQDLVIPSIRLEKGENSTYRLNVDGIPGKSFQNIDVLAKDSIFVFVENTTDISQQTNATSFLYTDKVLFDPEGSVQDVDLISLVKDAVFLFPARDRMTGKVETLLVGTDSRNNEISVEGFFLKEEQLVFSNEKPYVIYGYAAIPPEKTLTIAAGARIHFHNNSGLIAANKATLLVKGEASEDAQKQEKEVVFAGDRLEPGLQEQPGQWGAIWLSAGSTGHQIEHATIKNGSIGILVDANTGFDEPNLRLRNTQIYNMASAGIRAQTAYVTGENIVINNAGQMALHCALGGKYDFNHCTFANYWNSGPSREFAAVVLDNFSAVNGTSEPPVFALQANFRNCIIYGNKDEELSIQKVGNTNFVYSFQNCLIRFEDRAGDFATNPLYDFSNSSLFSNSLLSRDPQFIAIEKNLFGITEDSPANNSGVPTTATTDITNLPRDPSKPDIGAYESKQMD